MKQSLVWNCIGDSITAPCYVDKHYYDYIAERNLQVNFEIHNYGICGTTIAGDDKDSFCNRYTEMGQADIITVFGGVNDWGRVGKGGATPLGNISDTNKMTFYGALNTLCEGLKNKYSAAFIIFMTPIGSCGYEGTHGFASDKNAYGLTVGDYAKAMIEVCKKYGFFYVDLYHDCSFSPQDAVQNSAFFVDGLHLNERGHLVISYLIECKIRHCFEKQNLNLKKDEVDLFLFMGQSNMAGRGEVSSKFPDAAPSLLAGAGYEYRAISAPGQLFEITEPFGKREDLEGGIHDSNRKTGSMVTSFVNSYYTYSGRKIIGISAAEGGTSISEWQPGGKRLKDAISRMEDACLFLKKNNNQIAHIFMLWCQGETDGDHGVTSARYRESFLTMYREMKLRGVENCFIVPIGKQGGRPPADYVPILRSQQELAWRNTDIVLVSEGFVSMAERGLMKDSYHYYQKAYNEVGTEAGIHTAYYVMSGCKPDLFLPSELNFIRD